MIDRRKAIKSIFGLAFGVVVIPKKILLYNKKRITPNFSSGGLVPGFGPGGLIPVIGDGDRIPAMLNQYGEEFIIPRSMFEEL